MRYLLGMLALILPGLLVPSAWSEDIGPFSSTPIAAVAPQCNAPNYLQRFPESAFGNGVYLVAWSDGSTLHGLNGADIYCARIEAATGRVLDPSGIKVCGAANVQGYPVVTFGNGKFLVAWEDFRNNRDYDVYASRVLPDGTVQDPDGFAVSVLPGVNEARPAVGFGAGNFLVAWSDARKYPVYGVMAARITGSKEILDPDGFAVVAESDANVNAVKPANGRWMGDKERWWNGLLSYYQPSIASKDSLCLITCQSCRDKDVGKVVCLTVNAGTGWVGTVKTTDLISKGAAGSCALPEGWAIAPDYWEVTWDGTPYFLCERFSSLPAPQDVITGSISTAQTAVPVLGLLPYYVQGKGFSGVYKTVCAWNGNRIIEAKSVGYRSSRTGRVQTAIAMARLTDTVSVKRFADATMLYVDASSDSLGQYTASGSLTAGPSGECLLVYEKYYKLDSCLVLSRIIRER